MRYRPMLALAALCLAGSATIASAAVFSLPVPTLPSGFQSPAFQHVADHQLRVAVKAAHLRAKPTIHSTRLATLVRGTKVDLVGMVDHGKWAHVRVAGKTGYISANLLK